MAVSPISFKRALVRYANTSADNLATVTTWHDEALLEIASNKGGHLISGTTNGSSFTQSATMTNAEWFTILSDVLEHVDRGTTPQSRTIARLN